MRRDAGNAPPLPSFISGDTPVARERFPPTIPLGRFTTPADLGHAAAFLASDEAAMITGAALEDDGRCCLRPASISVRAPRVTGRPPGWAP